MFADLLYCESPRQGKEQTLEEETTNLSEIRLEILKEKGRLTYELSRLINESAIDGFKECKRIILLMPKDETERWKRCHAIRMLPWVSAFDKSLEPEGVEIIKSIITSDSDENARTEAIAAFARLETNYDPPLPKHNNNQIILRLKDGIPHRTYQNPPPLQDTHQPYSCSYEHLLIDNKIIKLLSDKLLNDPSKKVRVISAIALGVSPDSRPINQALINSAKKDKDETVREACLKALSDKDVPNLLEEMLSILETDPSEWVRAEAIFWMEHYIKQNKYDERIGDVIMKVLAKEKSEWVIECAIKILSNCYILEKKEEKKNEYIKVIRSWQAALDAKNNKPDKPKEPDKSNDTSKPNESNK